MPQLNKGGKFVYGFSIINDDLSIKFPPGVLQEYKIKNEDKIIIFSSSKTTGGFCVTTKNLLENSKLNHILKNLPQLKNFEMPNGKPIKYKNKIYTWLNICDGKVTLTDEILKAFELERKMKLLSIKSSDIAFTMGAKGILLKRANEYKGEIEVY